MTQEILPLSRSQALYVQPIGDEILVYDATSNTAFALNSPAALVYGYCNGKRNVAEIVRLLRENSKVFTNQQTVWYALWQLSKSHLLVENVALPPGYTKLTRRQFVRLAGVASAAAVPVILKLAAPTPAAAATPAQQFVCVCRNGDMTDVNDCTLGAGKPCTDFCAGSDSNGDSRRGVQGCQ